MRYPGGKGGSGVYQKIINLIPPHETYIEPFVGGGNIFERKTPAASSILIDRDPCIEQLWKQRCGTRADLTIINADAVPWLKEYEWKGNEFVYLDPPYVLSTRTKQKIYAFEMSDDEHRELISAIVAMSDRGIKFILSGYRNDIYDDAAKKYGWHREDFQAMTRRGLKTESVWFNYERPAVLASYDYVGSCFRERERIKRKISRWVEKLKALPAIEREALIKAMQELGESQ